MRHTVTRAFAALVLAAAPLSAAEARRPLTPEDVVSLPVLSDPRIAPAGDRVAFVVTRLTPPRERASEVWVVNVDGQGLARVPLEQARAPRWSPDGRTLAVVAAAPGGPAVHLFTPADQAHRVLAETAGAREAAFSSMDVTSGGVPRAVAAAHAGTFWDAVWSADGQRLLAAMGEGTEHALAAVDLAGQRTRLGRGPHGRRHERRGCAGDARARRPGAAVPRRRQLRRLPGLLDPGPHHALPRGVPARGHQRSPVRLPAHRRDSILEYAHQLDHMQRVLEWYKRW